MGVEIINWLLKQLHGEIEKMPNQEMENVHYTREILMKMNDRQLGEMMDYLKTRIEDGKRRGRKTHEDEVEFCYLQDEFFRRSKWNHKSRNRGPSNTRFRGQNTREAVAVRPRRRNFNNDQ